MITIIRVLCVVVGLYYMVGAAVSYKDKRTDDLIWYMGMAILIAIGFVS